MSLKVRKVHLFECESFTYSIIYPNILATLARYASLFINRTRLVATYRNR